MNDADWTYIQGTYLPPPNPRRSGRALCLSGGGFRAALFHLGAARRLNELGVLSQIDAISSVSGGSIFSAHLLQRIQPWPAPGTVIADWEERVARPFRAFTQADLRTGPVVQSWLPWNWPRKGIGSESLAAAYAQRLTKLRLTDLPDRPKFVFCATDMQFGVNWVFEKRCVGDYQAGWLAPAPDWPVARAVAASSCFPPVFDPMAVGLTPAQLERGKASPQDRAEYISRLSLTDGGVYDNMGLEPVWKTYETVLVSNGGATFDYEADWNAIARLLRYTTIQGNQAGAIRRRWLIASYNQPGMMTGSYWGIGSAVENYEQAGFKQPEQYSDDLVKRVIAEVRTDMDAFSDAEIAVLENHGYLLANAAVQRWIPTLAAHPDAPLLPPHPEWMDEPKARQALAQSSKRNWLGRK